MDVSCLSKVRSSKILDGTSSDDESDDTSSKSFSKAPLG